MAKESRLFSITYFLLKAATLLAFLLGGILVLCLGGVLLVLGTSLAETLNIPATLEGLPRNQLLTIAAVALAGGLACVVLATLVLVLISKIVETAMTGDPFVDQNANRLTRVGWLLLGIYGVGMITGVAAVALMPPKLIEMAGKEGGHIQFDAGFDPSPIGILTVLLIFVLAQIFRRGAEMRAELEGTV
jgi:hypothetical protein